MKRFLVLAALALNPLLTVQAQKTAVNGLVQLSAADSGQHVNVKAGDQIRISLTGNPTTGYVWYALEPDVKYFKLLKKEQQTTKNGLPGGSIQTVTYTFRVQQSLNKGTYTVMSPLSFIYYAPGRSAGQVNQMVEFLITSP